MAKKKAPRPATRLATRLATRSTRKPTRKPTRKAVRRAARKVAGRARTAMKNVVSRAASARKTVKTAMKKAARRGNSLKKAATTRVHAASKQIKATARKQVKATTKSVETVVQRARVQQQVVAQSATSAFGKATTLAKAVKASVTAALTPPAPAASKARLKRPPSLDRVRKTVNELHGAPSSLGAGAVASSAKSGGNEFKHKLQRHTSSSPALTAGDVDADWESADSTGDEAPGGDNPTPDQDVVEEIGRALGVEYEDDEELQGGDEIADRDRHRWELDPSSAEDSEDSD